MEEHEHKGINRIKGHSYTTEVIAQNSMEIKLLSRMVTLAQGELEVLAEIPKADIGIVGALMQYAYALEEVIHLIKRMEILERVKNVEGLELAKEEKIKKIYKVKQLEEQIEKLDPEFYKKIKDEAKIENSAN